MLNPASAEGAALRRWRELEPVAETIFPHLQVTASAARGDLRRAARAFAERGSPVLLLAAGGDGTSHEVINGVMEAAGHRATIGWIPIGSGNDMARSVGVPLERPACLEWYRRYDTAAIDVGRIRYRTPAGEPASLAFGNSFTLGISADVLRICQRGGKRLGGGASYFLATMRALAGQQPFEHQVVIDARAVLLTGCRLISVTNGPTFGAGMRITPAARLDDGRLDLTWVSGLSRAGTVALFPRIYWGGHVGHRAVRQERIQKLSVLGDTALAFEADGELIEGRLPIEVEVVPAGVRIARGAGPSSPPLP